MHEITSFADESIVTEETVQQVVLPSIAPDPYLTNSLVQFLQRPFPVAEYVWDSSKKVGDKLGTLTFPNVIFKIPSILPKLRNYRYFRGGVRIGVRLNGTRFHYGKLLVSYSPCSTQTADFVTQTDNIYSASGFPNVVLTPTENEVHEIVLPYALPFLYIDLADWGNAKYNIGSVIIRVLNPLMLAATTNSVGVTVYASFENVDLAGMSQAVTGVFPDPTYLDADQPNGPRILAQAGPEATKKSAMGVISGPAETVSAISGSLRTIPFLGSYMGILSGISAGIGMIARSLGYCKPVDVSSLAPVIIKNYDLASAHGLETGIKMAMNPKNEVAGGHDLMGSFEGEMSLMNLFQTPSIVQISSWTTSTLAGNKLFEFSVSPFNVHTELANAITTAYPTVLAFSALPFYFWRGSLRFCLQVTCSAFHSGRIRIAWEPDVGTDYVASELGNCINHVLDVQTESQYYFTIPYLVANPWLVNGGLESFPANSADRGFANGKIVVDVINALTHPDDPVPAVYLNLWISAGADFQVAFPTCRYLKFALPPAVLEAQGLTRETMKVMDYDTIIPGTSGSLDVGLTMGETISSIKELLLRPCLRYTFKPVLDSSVVLIPNFPDLPAFTNTDVYSYIDWYRYIYRFARGSVSYKFVVRQKTANKDVHLLLTNHIFAPTDAKTAITSKPVLLNNQGSAYAKYPQTINLDVTIPYYCNLYSVINSTKSIPMSMPGVVLSPTYEDSFPTDLYVDVYVAAGDDYTLGFQIGPPKIMIKNATPPTPASVKMTQPVAVFSDGTGTSIIPAEGVQPITMNF